MLGLGPDSPIAGPPYPAHAITERFRLNTAYPLVRSVSPATTAPPGRTAQTIVNSGPSSWGETDLKAMTDRAAGQTRRGRGQDGPGVARRRRVGRPPRTRRHRRRRSPARTEPPAPKPETRVAVFGDSDFAANLGINIEGNADLFLNTVNWLVQQENLIAIRPKQPDDRRVTLTGRAAALGRAGSRSCCSAGRRHRHGRLHLVEATRMNRGATRCCSSSLGLGLGAYIYFVEMKREPASDTPEAKLVKVFPNVDAAKVEEVQVKASAGDQTTLRKANNVWTIAAPVEASADDSEASGLASSLSSLEIQRDHRRAAEGARHLRADEAAHRSRRSAPPATRSRVGCSIGDKTATGGEVYAKLAREAKVFLISGFLESTFDKTTFQLRDKSVLKFDREKVDAITVEIAKSPPLAIAKQGDVWSITQPWKARADFGAVESLLSRLTSGQMKSIVSPPPNDAEALAVYGLAPAERRITLKAGSATAGILLGKPTPEGDIYAKDVSRPMIFTVEKALADDVSKSPADYRTKDVFGFRAFTGTRLEIARGRRRSPSRRRRATRRTRRRNGRRSSRPPPWTRRRSRIWPARSRT